MPGHEESTSLSLEEPEARLEDFLGRLPQLRRQLGFAGAIHELEELSAGELPEEKARLLAKAAAPLLQEAALWQRFLGQLKDQTSQAGEVTFPGSPEGTILAADERGFELRHGQVVARRTWTSVKTPLLLRLLQAQLAGTPTEHVHLASFALFRGEESSGFQFLRSAGSRDSNLKTGIDEVLAAYLERPVPVGGFEWWQGRPMESQRVHRMQLLEETLTQTRAALGENTPPALLRPSLSPEEWPALAAPLAQASASCVQALRVDYELLRDSIASLRRSPALKRQRIDHVQRWDQRRDRTPIGGCATTTKFGSPAGTRKRRVWCSIE
jgi:hypothetical protein